MLRTSRWLRSRYRRHRAAMVGQLLNPEIQSSEIADDTPPCVGLCWRSIKSRALASAMEPSPKVSFVPTSANIAGDVWPFLRLTT
jgi:hypothetical protein